MFDRYNDDWERLAWVLLRGRASLVTDAGEKAQAVAALRRKYPHRAGPWRWRSGR